MKENSTRITHLSLSELCKKKKERRKRKSATTGA
jgi:hypothetical protein